MQKTEGQSRCASASETNKSSSPEPERIENERQGSIYVFPGSELSCQPPLLPSTTNSFIRSKDQEDNAIEVGISSSIYPRPRRPPCAKAHTRSASHGGVLATSTTGWQSGIRPSALKKPGHQRAFSQGQVVDIHSGPLILGHNRVGSKTDFILPPGHKEESRPPTTGKVPSFRGHSRQASRSESIYTIRRSVAPPWWRRVFTRCFGSLPEEPRLRRIIPNHLVLDDVLADQNRNNSKVQTNRIRTTKYTTLTFLPRNLLEQFHRVANLYFLFIVMLNWLPSINAFGKEIALVPVLFVLGVTAIKDYFEDRRRLASDKRVNNSTCRIYTREGDRYSKIAWKDVRVGDLVHLSNNELVPADVLLLRSSDPQGFAYLDTCNLDGESNLKQRQVVRGFLELSHTFEPAKFQSVVEVDQPSTRIYRFHGAVIHPTGGRVPVSTENLLLRGCLLKNTDFVEGIVVYAGHETKAMLNNDGPRYKRSRLERQMNMDVIWCMVILVILCVVGAAGCRVWLSSYEQGSFIPFLPVLMNPTYDSVLTFWTFVIILQIMIPLSLYVTIEMAKVGQVYHIGQDRGLYDEETGRGGECRAMNITEDLGQVQYLFSDKTGTLTENKMLFRRCVVEGEDYSHTGNNENLIISSRMKEDLFNAAFSQRLQEFLILLATCNTVVVNSQPHYDTMNSSGVIEELERSPAPAFHVVNSSRSQTNPNKLQPPLVQTETINLSKSCFKPIRPKRLNISSIPSLGIGLLTKKHSPNDGDLNKSIGETPSIPAIYEAESPDELALVNAARAYGVKLVKRTPQSVGISLPDKSYLTYEILNILPFDSNRKCMSILVRHPNTGEITLYSKGADSTMMASLTSNDQDSMTTLKVKQQLQSYARQGLRTLVMAYKSLNIQDYENWKQKLVEAELCVENRDRCLRECYMSLESQLNLLGATGIEDKLQSGVPEAIVDLINAGIVIWVLTGDKPETAVNVAYSARLFSPTTQLLRLQARSKSIAEGLIRGYLESMRRESIAGVGVRHRVEEDARDYAERDTMRVNNTWPKQRALVIDGKTLTVILDPKSGLIGLFLELTKNCSSVLACRATPLQKAYIVRVVKEQLGVRTLAIGDGANDVSMIQTADLGVGIYGREGSQAVMAADFAIARFPMLSRLIILHGHWCYDRLSRMILYFFYKNATFVFLVFWYQLYCGFSGAVMIDQIYLMLNNLLFTSLPPLALGIYDRVAPASVLLSTPQLYRRGRLSLVYQPHSFWITMADALYQSIVIFFITGAAYYDSVVDIWEFGSTITSACIVVMLIHVSIEIKSWTIIHVVVVMGSLLAFFAFSLFYNAVCVNCMGLPGSYWVMQIAITRHVYWLTIVLASVLAIIPKLIYKVVESIIAPDIVQIATLEKNNCRQRIIDPEDSNFIAGWSRSGRHTTVR